MYSGSSIGKIVTAAASEAGIERRVYPHMLRHSFATLLMERGVELRLIQEALGHSSSKTTEIYTYVSRATIKKMPVLLDEMKI
jgi:site-specific recombinase XerD